jgi:hypothetical protein
MLVRVAALAVVASLAACASMPLSTLARMSRLDAATLATLDGADLRVRVSLPEGYVLDAAGSRLALRLSGGGVTRESAFAMQQESTASRHVSRGLLGGTAAVTAYELRLTPASRRELAMVQQSIRDRPVSDVDVDVRVALSTAPKDATATTVWVDIALSPQEGYFPLVEAGTLPLDGSAIRESNHR